MSELLNIQSGRKLLHSKIFDLKGEGTKESPIIFDVFGDLCVYY